jgi:hypothetical protein
MAHDKPSWNKEALAWASNVGSEIGASFSKLYASVSSFYEQRSRANDYRRMQADNSMAACIAELRSVKAAAQERITAMRVETAVHARALGSELQDNDTEAAKVSTTLMLMYRTQCIHAMDTLVAIEAHILLLETHAVNRRVVRALKSAGPTDDCEETDAEDALDLATERHDTSQRIMQIMREVPSSMVSQESVEQAMQQAFPCHSQNACVSGETHALQMPVVPVHTPKAPVVSGDWEEKKCEGVT